MERIRTIERITATGNLLADTYQVTEEFGNGRGETMGRSWEADLRSVWGMFTWGLKNSVPINISAIQKDLQRYELYRRARADIWNNGGERASEDFKQRQSRELQVLCLTY